MRSDGERNGEFTELADSATKWAAGPEGSRAPPEKKILRALTDNLRPVFVLFFFLFQHDVSPRLGLGLSSRRAASQP